MYKFFSEDRGNCRVYYKRDKRLYCIQDDGSWGSKDFKFYTCSKDGEPDSPMDFPSDDQFDRIVYPS